MNGIPDYNSPAELNAFLESKGMAMQKKFGQNFLINESARKKIAASLGIQKGETVWEVGPGLGAMTKELVDLGAKVTVFEIDRGFASLISGFFEDYSKGGTFRIVEGDVMKTWKGHLKEAGQPDRFFGNREISSTFKNRVSHSSKPRTYFPNLHAFCKFKCIYKATSCIFINQKILSEFFLHRKAVCVKNLFKFGW